MSTTTESPRDLREWRRLRAWELAQQGWKQRAIARALGVTEGAISQWLKRAREGGKESLRRRIAPGPPSRLSADQRAQIPVLLSQGAEAHGFRGNVWTAPRVAVVIARTFGVSYHPTHVNRLLHALGWSVQQPEVKATQRDPVQVDTWLAETWPTLKQRPEKKSEPSSGRMKPASISCRPGSEPTPPKGRPRP